MIFCGPLTNLAPEWVWIFLGSARRKDARNGPTILHPFVCKGVEPSTKEHVSNAKHFATNTYFSLTPCIVIALGIIIPYKGLVINFQVGITLCPYDAGRV